MKNKKAKPMAHKIAPRYKTHCHPCPSVINPALMGAKKLLLERKSAYMAMYWRAVDIRDQYLAERLNRSTKESL
jgi:hypothetical protein